MEKLTQGWVQHLRSTARQEAPTRNYQCPLCEEEFQPSLDAFREHVRADATSHPNLAENSDIEKAFEQINLRGKAPSKTQLSGARDDGGPSGATRKRPVSGNIDVAGGVDDDWGGVVAANDGADSRPGTKKLCSPPGSVTQQRGSSPPTPGRSRARASEVLNEFDRGFSQSNSSRQLWSPEDERASGSSHRPKTSQARNHQLTTASRHRPSPQRKTPRRQPHQLNPSSLSDDSVIEMIRQPDTRPISSEQLVAEVQGIYAGLVLLEGKCIEYDSSQRSADLNEEQYHALVSLHRSLLHEHHDFLLASQHPSANDGLRRLPSKYAMPARMWRHAIHSFLELLRQKLPTALEHMMTFIYIAYNMMTLLYETVPAFKDTWIECLGDLGRYRMAIEDGDLAAREAWTIVSRDWYTKASDKAPTTGRLYHHLAILARPNILQQLYYYTKALCVPIPFNNARESVMTLFDPLLEENSNSLSRLEPVDTSFVRVFAILFSRKAMDQLEATMEQFFELLDGRIGREQGNWLQPGYHMSIAISCGLLGFGETPNPLMRAIPSPKVDGDSMMVESEEDLARCQATFDKAIVFASRTYKIVMGRWADRNTLPCLHTTLVFYKFMAEHPDAMKHLEKHFPWKQLSIILNYLLRTCESAPRMESAAFPGPEKNDQPHPLPEDYAMRGLLFTEDYFPDGWFENDNIEDDEKYFEPASTVEKRRERILWIGRRMADYGNWLTWDAQEKQFSVKPEYEEQIHSLSAASSSAINMAKSKTKMVRDDQQNTFVF